MNNMTRTTAFRTALALAAITSSPSTITKAISKSIQKGTGLSNQGNGWSVSRKNTNGNIRKA